MPVSCNLIEDLKLADEVTTVATRGKFSSAKISVGNVSVSALGPAEQQWKATISTGTFGKIDIVTQLSGHHNIANITQTVATLACLCDDAALERKPTASQITSAIASFTSVKRRLDYIGTYKGAELYEDFAHHPTAMRVVIEGFRSAYPDKRLSVAFEPRSAIQRRNIFQQEYSQTLALADRVYIGQLFVDKRIPQPERMDINALRVSIGDKARSFSTNEEMAVAVAEDLAPGDAVIFMSSGSFSGVQHKLAQKIDS